MTPSLPQQRRLSHQALTRRETAPPPSLLLLTPQSPVTLTALPREVFPARPSRPQDVEAGPGLPAVDCAEELLCPERPRPSPTGPAAGVLRPPTVPVEEGRAGGGPPPRPRPAPHGATLSQTMETRTQLIIPRCSTQFLQALNQASRRARLQPRPRPRALRAPPPGPPLLGRDSRPLRDPLNRTVTAALTSSWSSSTLFARLCSLRTAGAVSTSSRTHPGTWAWEARDLPTLQPLLLLPLVQPSSPSRSQLHQQELLPSLTTCSGPRLAARAGMTGPTSGGRPSPVSLNPPSRPRPLPGATTPRPTPPTTRPGESRTRNSVERVMELPVSRTTHSGTRQEEPLPWPSLALEAVEVTAEAGNRRDCRDLLLTERLLEDSLMTGTDPAGEVSLEHCPAVLTVMSSTFRCSQTQRGTNGLERELQPVGSGRRRSR